MHVKLLSSSELEAAYRLRYQVYCLEKGYLDAGEYTCGMEADEYDAGAVHIGCYDDNGLVGYARIITPSVREFPIERHFQLHTVPGSKWNQCEISRLIVATECRATKAMKVLRALVRAVVAEAEKRGLFHAFAVVEAPLLALLRRSGLPFEQIGQVEQYMNTDNYPCVVSADRIDHDRIGLSPDWQRRHAERGLEDGVVMVV